MTRARSLARELVKRSVAPALFLAAWELAPRLGVVSSFAIPPFSDAMTVLFELMAGGALFEHIGISLFRAMTGLAIATVLGVWLGVLLGMSGTAHDMISLLVELLRPISPIALVSVGLFLFGIGSPPIIFATVWGCFFPIVLNTIAGVRGVNRLYVDSARSMMASRVTIFRDVVWPAALPSILTGFRISTGISLIVIIAGEMMYAAKSGLGFLAMDGFHRFEQARVYGVIVVIGILGYGLNVVQMRIQRYALRWQRGITLE